MKTGLFFATKLSAFMVMAITCSVVQAQVETVERQQVQNKKICLNEYREIAKTPAFISPLASPRVG